MKKERGTSSMLSSYEHAYRDQNNLKRKTLVTKDKRKKDDLKFLVFPELISFLKEKNIKSLIIYKKYAMLDNALPLDLEEYYDAQWIVGDFLPTLK